MNVLIFSHYSEVSGDKIQAERLCSLRTEFQKLGHKVHFLYLDLQKKITAAERAALGAKFDSFEHVSSNEPRTKKVYNRAPHDERIFQENVGAKLAELCTALQPEIVVSTFGYSSSLFDHVLEKTVRVVDAYGVKLSANQSTVVQLRKADIVIVENDVQKLAVNTLSSSTPCLVVSSSTGAISKAGSSIFKEIFNNEKSLANAVGCDFELKLTRHAKSQVVVMVTHARFWQPGWGSHVRISQLVRELSKHYRLVVFFPINLSENDRSDLDGLGLSFEYDWVKENVIWDRSGSENIVMGEVDNAVVREAFTKTVAKYKPDACLFEYLRFSYLTSVLPSSVVKIIDTHDLVSRRQESRTRYEKAIPVSRKAEIKALSRYDYVIAIQRTEAAIVETWLNRLNVMYVPVCYEEKTLSGMRLSEDAPTEINVGFIGGESEANVSAIKWFMASVWPYFTGSNLRLLVAGDVGKVISNPPANVSVLGRVDIDEFYRSVHFIINPVQWGGGMKIKTVEALSYGLPLVSTSEGAAGLEEASERGLFITDAPEEFAYLMGQLARDTERRVEQGKEAKSFVRSEFDTNVVFNDLHSVIQMARPYSPVK